MMKLRVGWLVLLTLSGVGCMPEWVRNSVWDPTAVGRYTMRDAVTTQVIRSVSIQDLDDAIIAEPPKEDDLVIQYSDYVLKPNDIIQISVFELLFEGYDQTYTRQISDLGFITVPVLGTFKASGKTARQLEIDVANRLRGEILIDPQVTIQLVSQRQEYFNALGGIRPGQYPLERRSLRLVEVVAMLGDVPNPDIKTLYIIRQRRPKARTDQNLLNQYKAAAPSKPLGLMAPGLGALTEMVRSGTAVEPASQPAAETGQPGAAPAAPATNTSDLQAALAESALGTQPARKPSAQPSEAAPEAAPAGSPAVLAPEPPAKASIWVSGRGWVEVSPQPREAAAPSPEVDWEALQQSMPIPRIIGIPIEDLRRGDPRYNIVLRDGDLLYAPNVKVGEFYVMGQVARPGAYLFNGRDITLKQAVAAAGNLGTLAWPQHCQLVRRIGGDREEHVVVDLDAIFAGRAPDIYMKPQDLLNVGTNFVTTFLAAIRTGFYANYGFSFSYERNFYGMDGFDLTPNDGLKSTWTPSRGSFTRRMGGGLMNSALGNIPTLLAP